jgi:O-antigen/teichoic acid export membrane protein
MTRDVILYFLIRVGNGLFAVATLAVFTRMLTPENYGFYSLAMAGATFVATALFQWQNVSVARYYPIHSENPKNLLIAANTGFWISAVLSILLIRMALFCHSWKGIDFVMAGVICIMGILYGRHNLLLQLANVSIAPMRYAMLSWVRGGVTLLLGVVLIWSGIKAYGAIIASLIGFGAAILLINPIKQHRIPWRVGEWGIAKVLFHYGFPLSLTIIAISVVDLSARLMIGWLSGVKEVGYYAAPYDFTQLVINACMNVLFLAGFPRAVVALEKDGEAVAFDILRRMGQAMLVLGIPITLGVALLAGDIARLIFGSGIQIPAERVMPWVATATFIAGFKSFYLDSAFQLRKNTRPMAYIAITMAIASVVTNFFLLRHFGALGAAWATLGAFTLGSILSYQVGKTIMNLGMPWLLVRGVALACLPMVLLLLGMHRYHGPIWLMVKICLGGMAYLVMCWWVNLVGSRGKVKAFFSTNLLKGRPVDV